VSRICRQLDVPTTDKPVYLRWLVTGPAVPWVPSIGELAGALAEIKKVIDVAYVERARRMGGEGERDFSPQPASRVIGRVPPPVGRPSLHRASVPRGFDDGDMPEDFV
jgi:hypothetical protein